MSEEDLAEGLRKLGYQLRPHEMRMLTEQVDLQSQAGAVSKSAFLASQIDWHQEDLRRVLRPSCWHVDKARVSLGIYIV